MHTTRTLVVSIVSIVLEYAYQLVVVTGMHKRPNSLDEST